MNPMPKRKVWGSIDEGPDKEEKVQEKKMEKKKDKYTYSDIICHRDDPRVKDAIGKECYFSGDAITVLEYANNDRNDYKGILGDIYFENLFPFGNSDEHTHYRFIIVKKEPTYAERQAEWIKENDIKVGDKVKVVSLWTDEDAAREKCIPRHDVPSDIVGSVCKIDKITRLGLRVDFGEYMWYCPYFVLEKIVEPEKKYVPFDLSDPEVRKSLRGRWIISKDEESPTEILIHQIAYFNSTHDWRINGCSSSYWFENYTFDDGTPFGKEVEE